MHQDGRNALSNCGDDDKAYRTIQSFMKVKVITAAVIGEFMTETLPREETARVFEFT